MATTRIDIEGSASGLLTAAKQAQQALGGIQTSATSVQKSLDLIKFDSIVNLARRALGASSGLMALSDAATVTMNKMRSVSSSSEQASAAFSTVMAISNKTGLAVEAVGETFQKIALISKSMGWSMNDAATMTENLALAMKATGTAGPAAASAMYQLTQALGRGTVAYEDLKQVQESAAPVLEMIAKQFGMSSAQFLKAVQNMQVGSDDLKNAIKGLGDEANASISKMAPTFAEATNKIRNNFIGVLDQLEAKTGIFSEMAKAIKNLGDHFDIILPGLAAFAGYLAASRIAAFVITLLEAVTAVRKFGIAMAVMEGLATGGIAAITGLAGAAAAYIGASALFDKIGASAEGTSKDLDKLGSSVEAVNKKAPLKLEGPRVDVKALQDGLDKYLQQYKVLQSIGVTNDHRQEQEQAVLAYATQNNLTYEKMVKNAAGIADQIREAVKQEQLRKAAMAIRGQTNTGIQDTANFQLEAAQYGQSEALRQGDLKLAQEYADQMVLIRQKMADDIRANDLKLFETQMQMSGVVNADIINVAKTTMQQAQMVTQGGIVGIQGAIGMLGGFLEQAGKQNKKAFEAQKAVAIAQTIISTYQAATQAFAAMSAIPFVGPALGFAAAATIVAAGLANVAQIRNQQYSGRALGGPVMGGKSYIVGESGPELFTPNTTGNITRNDHLGGAPVNVNFSINAVDASGIDDLLIQRRGMITQFVRDAMQEQGQRSKM